MPNSKKNAASVVKSEQPTAADSRLPSPNSELVVAGATAPQPAAKRQRRARDALPAYTPPDLAALVQALIPAYLKRTYDYTITRAEITPDAPLALANLCMDIFRIYDGMTDAEIHSRSPVLNVSAHLLCDKNTGELCVKLLLSIGGPRGSSVVKPTSLQRDLDAFEREFEKNARRELPSVCEVIGHGAVIPYILLCMLVYTEHVFAPLDDRKVERTQRRAPHAEAVRKMLEPYFDMDGAWEAVVEEGEGSYGRLFYPFLVRLMPVEFALDINCEDMLNMFIFVKQSNE
jgi:hypothetical protein